MYYLYVPHSNTYGKAVSHVRTLFTSRQYAPGASGPAVPHAVHDGDTLDLAWGDTVPGRSKTRGPPAGGCSGLRLLVAAIDDGSSGGVSLKGAETGDVT